MIFLYKILGKVHRIWQIIHFVMLCISLYSIKLQEHTHYLIHLFYRNRNYAVLYAGFIAFKSRSVNGTQTINENVIRHIRINAWEDNCFDLEICYPEILKMTLGFKLSSYLKYLKYWIIQQLKLITEAVIRRCSLKKRFYKISQNSRENTCVCIFIKRETPAPVLSFEFCAVFWNNSFVEHQWTIASVIR